MGYNTAKGLTNLNVCEASFPVAPQPA